MQANGSVTRLAQWLALGAASGAIISLALDYSDIAGPWKTAALWLAAMAMLGSLISSLVSRKRERELFDTREVALRSEAERSELARELERHAVLEQQLRAAKQEAESAMMARGEFLATMSHEIRTPLNGIIPTLDMLLSSQLQPDQQDLARTAFMASQQMLRIVDDILDYSKLESTHIELERTSFNLRETLEGVLRIMERGAKSKGLQMSLVIDPRVRLQVRGDPVRLRQVLTNLISNAIKFTERGTIELSIIHLGESSAAHQLRFEVHDNGIGIAPDAQKRLFQAFHQADASTTRLYGGTGLGLAICKRIIDLMGGRIGVDSELGHGSRFWFEIPMLKILGDTRGTQESLQGKRALILAQHPDARARLERLLALWGSKAQYAENTSQALILMRDAMARGRIHAFDLVIADMAGMRNTVVSLQRNVTQREEYGQPHLVLLSDDDPLPEGLHHERVFIVPRRTSDDELRAQILTAFANNEDAAAQTALAAAAAPPAPAEVDLTQARVLLVEDNPVNALVAQKLLGTLGLTCDVAGNGQEALERMQTNPYHVVLMDCQMPVLDGYSATQQWRESEAARSVTRRMPIIAMTANAMAGDRQKCMDAGMDDYLSKPVDRTELARCLRRWVGQSGPPIMPTPMPASVPKVPVEPSAFAPAAAVHAATVGLSATRPMAAAIPPEAASRAPPSDIRPQPMNEPIPLQPISTAPALDMDVYLELRGLLGADLPKLVDTFLADVPKHIAKLKDASIQPDYESLQASAHSLKSSSANLGAMLLSGHAARIEIGAKEKNLPRPAVAVALLADEFERVRRELLAQA